VKKFNNFSSLSLSNKEYVTCSLCVIRLPLSEATKLGQTDVCMKGKAELNQKKTNN
jgi:hypothetical protein